MSTLYIVRGIPGCGKSRFAESLKMLNDQTGRPYKEPEIVHLEADQFFVKKDGTYQFDRSKLKEAHEWCMNEFKKAIHNNLDIILSNTSTQAWEFEEYKKIAEENGYVVFCLIVENRHGGKNIHDVSEEKIEQMKKRFEVQL